MPTFILSVILSDISLTTYHFNIHARCALFVKRYIFRLNQFNFTEWMFFGLNQFDFTDWC